jgi:hypothetical protein
MSLCETDDSMQGNNEDWKTLSESLLNLLYLKVKSNAAVLDFIRNENIGRVRY